jgi:hypothetical protein
MMCSKSERFLAMELISSCGLSAMLHARGGLTHACEDLLALELVQLRRRLLEVEARLVTGAGHVCASVCRGCWAMRCRQKKLETAAR